MTGTYTADFRHEFETERREWLRRRFLWYTGVVGALVLLKTLTGVRGVFDDDATVRSAMALALVFGGVGFVLHAGAFLFALRRGRFASRGLFVRMVIGLIVSLGLLQLGEMQVVARMSGAFAQGDGVALAQMEAQAAQAPADEAQSPGAQMTERPPLGFAVGLGFLVWVAFMHILASLFIPWTARESILPLAPLLVIYAVIALFFFGDVGLGGRITAVAIAPLAGAPGVAIASWRHGRFRHRFHYRMLRGRYGEMKRELLDARRIHESLFPEPIESGAVRLDYRYEPMRQIGGDFLFTHVFPSLDPNGEGREPVSVIIIDVTGHGVPAALTVNRLHGELERIFGEEPDISPGEALRSLNRYVHLTLARHGVYATALCVRADPGASELRWASAGHPPAFLRRVDGRIEELGATTFLLGACHGEDFQPDEHAARFMPGDALIAYTDGAVESRGAGGEMLRIDGFRRAVAAAQVDPRAGGLWAETGLRIVSEHRHGPPADDTLIVELRRPLGAELERTARRQASAAASPSSGAASAQTSSITASREPSS